MIISDLPPKLILPEPPALIRPAPKPKLEFDYAGGFPAVLTRRRHNQRGTFGATALANDKTQTNATNYVFASQTIGTSTASRDIIVFSFSGEQAGSAAATQNEIRVGAFTTDIIGQAEGTGSNEANSAIATDTISGTTTGNVDIDLSQQTGRHGYCSYEVEGFTDIGTAASSDGSTASGSSISITLTVGPAQVAAVGVMCANEAAAGSWNVTFEDLTQVVGFEGGNGTGEGGLSFDTGTYTYTPDSGSDEMALFGAVFNLG